MSDSGVGGGLCFGGQRAHSREGDSVCLCEIECVAMWSAVVASKRFTEKKRLWVDKLFVKHSVSI